MCQAFRLRSGQRGVLVTGVSEDSPAENAGLKAGDIIVSIDGEKTTSSGQLRSQIGVKGIGDKIEVGVIREGSKLNFSMNIAEPKATLSDIRGKYPQLLDGARFENHPQGKGVVVTGIAPNSNAAYSGLRQGDIIMGVNRLRVNNLDSFRKLLARDYDQLLLHINRNGRIFYLVIR